jgi:acetyl-CoA carboxylase biotin carboxyl carrier protein
MSSDGNKIFEVKAQISGVFYRAASPEAPPYVELGQEVQPKQVLCLLETMKLFSKVKSSVKGKVVEIIPKNEEAVVKDQVLFRIQQA